MSDFILQKDLAAELQMDRSALRKAIMRLGIKAFKVPSRKGTDLLAVSLEDAEKVKQELGSRVDHWGNKNNNLNGEGLFYIIQLVPDLQPTRVKLGFAASLEMRLRAHRTAAPTCEVIKTYPCRFTWEITAIASITRVECVPLSNEVFDCDNIENLIDRADTFFSLMPKIP